MLPRDLIRPALLMITMLAMVAAGCGSDEAAPDVADATTPTTGATVDSDTAAPEPDATDEGAGDAANDEAEPLFPDVLDATAERADDGTWTISATLSSPYDTPERYADAWRVLGADGTEYGIRVLTHDHANEQPFTRSHSGIEIPDDVAEVTIEGRDQLSGWGGETFTLQLEQPVSSAPPATG